MESRTEGRRGVRWSRVWLWLIAVAPLAWQLWRYLAERIYYGEFLHWTGLQATHLLLLTLAITPVVRALPRLQPFAWLRRHRRDLGLLTFVYAAAHTLVYLLRLADAARIIEEALEPGLLTGWIAMLAFALLAATSNNVSVRHLGKRWHWLHRAVYPAALLTLAHWILTAFDPTTAYIYLGLLLALLALRLRNRGIA